MAYGRPAANMPVMKVCKPKARRKPSSSCDTPKRWATVASLTKEMALETKVSPATVTTPDSMARRVALGWVSF